MRMKFHLLASALALAVAGTMAAPAHAQARQHYDLSEQDLGAALKTFAAVSGREVVASSDVVARKRGAAIRGDYPPEQAIAIVLARTGLRVEVVEGAFVIRPMSGPDATGADAAPQTDIIVTGTRIRGAKSPSAIVDVDREDMKSLGRTNVTDIARLIPQNFSGGQSPGIGLNVPASSGQDAGGGTAINLRGLGSAATLTLLNGHRLAYTGYTQGVDVSAIPFGAIERIEIVPDGASTIYGSDAVAGVVNVILRQRFTGLETSAKLSGSTDGGNFEQQYDAVAGLGWASGNVFAAYEFDRNTPIISSQRGYAATVRPNVTMYPGMRRNNAAGQLRQSLTSDLSLSIDGLYNQRSSSVTYPLNAAGNLSVSAGTSFYSTRSFTIAPSLEWTLPSNWRVSLAASYGTDKVDYGATFAFGATRTSGGAGFFRNRGTAIELSGDGDLFALPGGTAKLAVGGGFRRNAFQRFAGVSNAANVDRDQQSGYAFGELSAPLVRRVLLSAAVRYERYRGIGSVVTPKLGLILSPTPDFDLKASWGRSFRAPSLNQQYQPTTLYLATAGQFGGSAYPAGSTVLYEVGGSPSLKPERSTNWSATASLHPRSIRGLNVQLSYFSIDYTDRIVTPILFPSTSLSNPVYAPYLTLAPTSATQAATIAGAGTFTNLVGSYDPAKVVATIANTSINAGRQRARGFDAELRYKAVAGRDTFSALIVASYLTSRQQIAANQPITPLAGILFNPPNLRGRGELGWSRSGFGLVADINFIGPVRDTRVAGQSLRIAGMTPVDLTLRYRSTADHGFWRGWDVSISVQNIFNEAPTTIATSVVYDTPYDSTNYSSFGRVVGASVSKKW